MTDESSIENEESDIEYDFSCIKCGYDYSSYQESEYGFCDKCGNGRCKSCKSVCEDCEEESCFRCVVYLECCDKVTCCGYFHCEECWTDICTNCKGPETYCIKCEYRVCQNCISKEHKNKWYCIDCSIDHCIYCDSFPDYDNTCEDCVNDIKNVLEEEIPILPIDIIDLILDKTFDTKNFKALELL